MSKTRHYLNQLLFYLVVVIYILLLAKALLFKQVSLPELLNADRTISRAFNIIPFKTVLEYMDFNIWIALMNVAGNAVLFMPMGLYLQIFKKNKHALNCVAIVCAISLCVEIIQYGLGIGSADIDDIILNALGGLLGVLIYRIIYLIMKDENKTKTAVTFLFCSSGVIFGACYLVLVGLFGYRIRIL